MYVCVVQSQEEGIVVKALDAPWTSNDRGGNWCKMKPDYAFGIEIDCLIIGQRLTCFLLLHLALTSDC